MGRGCRGRSMNVIRDMCPLGCPLRVLTELPALLSSESSSALKASWNTSPYLSLLLFCRTRYPQRFCYQIVSILPISIRHLGLTHHCKGQHFIIHYNLFFFFASNVSILQQENKRKQKPTTFLQHLLSPPISQSKKEINFSPQAFHSPASSSWKEKDLL